MASPVKSSWQIFWHNSLVKVTAAPFIKTFLRLLFPDFTNHFTIQILQMNPSP